MFESLRILVVGGGLAVDHMTTFSHYLIENFELIFLSRAAPPQKQKQSVGILKIFTQHGPC